MIPRIKICGIKFPKHAAVAIEAGVTSIGLNFIPPSSRYVGGIKEAAALIKSCANSNILWAGIFVNPDFEELKVVLASVDLQIIQLHGDESPEFVRRVRARAPHAQIWKSFRIQTAADLRPIADYVCDAVVVDAKVSGTYGGTGQTFDWTILSQFERKAPLVLSGGLNPGNVAAAVQAVHPDWVDVASGTEISPGEKCCEKILDFIREAKRGGE